MESKIAEKPMHRDDLVIGRNPVIELLRSKRPVENILIQKDIGGSVGRIIAMAKEAGIPCKEVDKRKLDGMCSDANHQGVIAQIAAAQYSTIQDMQAKASAQNEPLFIVIADEIEDPHNLGAIIRTAEAAGAHGVIVPKRRSAGLTYGVYKASAGAALHLPVARVANIAQTISELKSMGVWIYCADTGGQAFSRVNYAGAAALVIGSEGQGVGRLIKERCDVVVSIPMRGQSTSLNASVASGIILFEIARQRQASAGSDK